MSLKKRDTRLAPYDGVREFHTPELVPSLVSDAPEGVFFPPLTTFFSPSLSVFVEWHKNRGDIRSRGELGRIDNVPRTFDESLPSSSRRSRPEEEGEERVVVVLPGAPLRARRRRSVATDRVPRDLDKVRRRRGQATTRRDRDEAFERVDV